MARPPLSQILTPEFFADGAVLLFAILHVIVCPYTKVEESFNVSGRHVEAACPSCLRLPSFVVVLNLSSFVLQSSEFVEFFLELFSRRTPLGGGRREEEGWEVLRTSPEWALRFYMFKHYWDRWPIRMSHTEMKNVLHRDL